MLRRQKVGIIGAGDIGLNLAEVLALHNYNVIVYNRLHLENNKPSTYWLTKQGFIMDLNDSLQLPSCGTVRLTSDFADLEDLDVIVITAGAKRSSPSETREELAVKNAKIIEGFIQLAVVNPSSMIFIISNPVDFLTQYFIEQLVARSKATIDGAARRVFGVSYIDTMRLRNITKEVLCARIPHIYQSYVEGMALGEHGPTMVPLISHVKVDGKFIKEIATPAEIEQIFKQTILRGNDIIKLTGMSSVTGPAHAAFFMINQILNQNKTELTCSVWDGTRCIGRNVVFYKGSFSHIEDTILTDEEKNLLNGSEKALDTQFTKLKSLLL
ncbi:MAG: mdh 1 [Rickettsiaceae bacterium]|jgi:malate dehydrogenase|nr:mdh 1 [Rickettsiaceae bacterium]